jgi:hypothetical protein
LSPPRRQTGEAVAFALYAGAGVIRMTTFPPPLRI